MRRIFDAAAAQSSAPNRPVAAPPTTAAGRQRTRARAWYDDLARAIGDDRVVIAFEPDSLGTIDRHARSRQDDRIRLLGYGVDVLSRLPNATIYLEAGASDWEPAKRTARQLRAIGAAKLRGFMLNATHYDWAASTINTAENGRGPVEYRVGGGRRITVWCNPRLRGLGIPPTTETSNSRVGAYLWVIRPGYAQSYQHRPIAWDPPRRSATHAGRRRGRSRHAARS